MTAQTTAELRAKYAEAVQRCWSPAKARARFAEYDRYRPQFQTAIRAWNRARRPTSLRKMIWQTCAEFNARRYVNCLDFNERKQRFYLGDGLFEYVLLLVEEIERVYGHAD